MLIWMCALHCEAKPVIDFYRLHKSSGKNDFDFYKNNDMVCIVSGMGEDSMIQAVNWAKRQFNQSKNLCWINLGVAGHKKLVIGSAVLISEATQTGNSDSISTMTEIEHGFESWPIISLTEEKTDYDEIALFDMEAYAFLQATRKFSSVELCQCIKVISDNSHTAPSRNKAEISALIAKNMKSILEFADQLQNC